MSFMEPSLLRTTVVGSYPFPSWLHHAVDHWNVFGSADQQEIIEDAVTVAIMDQIGAGLDVITDGEQTRLDFNLSFYGFLEGISLESASPRRWGPPAHDQRGRHAIVGPLAAPRGLGTVEDFERLKRLNPSQEVTLKASVPGPYTLSGRLIPGGSYTDRFAVTEAASSPHMLPETFRSGLLPLMGNKARSRDHRLNKRSSPSYTKVSPL